ncbi:MAG TPA: hypothetical protein VMV69_29275 [Pirellulales bacterium]|nr:hypothetical protein [Pirellulales bacterium]
MPRALDDGVKATTKAYLETTEEAQSSRHTPCAVAFRWHAQTVRVTLEPPANAAGVFRVSARFGTSAPCGARLRHTECAYYFVVYRGSGCPGDGRLREGFITIISDDDEHLKDFAEYMP